ncbi:MAG: amino acid adenylation domain-containing protein, partial [Flavitalea sp.]
LHEVIPYRKYNKTIPIGKPFSNTQVFVLSKDGAPCPIGIPGELHIGGDGVARGYLNNGELTREKFISVSFKQARNIRVYRTGDLVRYLPDGNIEFIGRADDQVKIRGYRVELGEIESIVLQSGFVRGATVLAREDKAGNKRLVGYLVTDVDFDREALENYLKEKLPDYMVPGYWVNLESFPLLPNGKVDRKSLPDPDVSAAISDRYEAPHTETELKLAELWQDVLEVERVGINDDFFELGGHSLLAVRLISMIRKQFNVEMPIGDIFDYPTIKLLAGRVHTESGKTILPVISRETRPHRIPLSFSQERLWFIDRLEGSIQYHVPAVLELNGTLNHDALSYALTNVIHRHEVLRTVILEQEGEPYQKIMEADGWELSVVNGSYYREHPDELQHFIETLVSEPFILSKDYMLRATLISLEEHKHVLVFILHHIASDGWSRSVLVKEVVELYASFEEQRALQLPPLTIQYADYAIWQRKYLEGDVLDKKIDFWKSKLQGIQPLQLPTDYPRPAVQSTKGARFNFSVDKELSAALQELSRQQGTTLFMTLLAAIKVLIHRYSGEQDICIGTPIANRMQLEVEGLIGFFVNTLALRSNVNSHDSFIELLNQVRGTTMAAYENQEAPFEKVVEAVVKGRDLSRNPIFQVMFVLRNTPEVPELRFGDLCFDAIGYEHTTSLFDLTFFITETPAGLQGSIEYSTDLYIETTIASMVSHLKELLHSVVRSPQQTIDRLTLLSKAEETRLLKEFNDTRVDYPSEKGIVDLFEEQVLRTPEAVAVVFGNEELSYQQLNAKANQLAHLLKNKGAKAETLIPVCIERSVEMIIGVLGILKAGAVYVPIDPDYPEERINYMLTDTDASIVLCSQKSKEKLQPLKPTEIIEIDGHKTIIDMQPSGNLQIDFHPHNLAYVLYTSGSTGKPKGVRMPAGALVNLLNWQEKQFRNHHRKVLQFASLNFDVSFQEIFSTLCFGSSLYLINGERRKDLSQVLADIRLNGITHLFIPYIVLKNLAEYILQLSTDAFSVEEIIVAGEQLKLTEDIQNLISRNKIKLINQYGPTEAHVVSSFVLDNASVANPLPPIGKPIDNTTLYILGNNGQPVPIGIMGELYIGGVQVARGYLNRPELTEQKFIDDPFSNIPGARLYKTGDLARWLQDGNIEYLGRIDDQVKIRGFRIELAEIESVIQECELVRQVVVTALSDSSGNKKLVSYVVPQGGFDKEALIGFVKKKLPEFMIPALWIELESMPITRNGKVDKRALPDPGIVPLVSTEYVAPRTEMELTLAAMWQQLLGIEKIGVYDNFFELGGHSLMVIKMGANIKKRFSLSIPIKALFQFTCINDLSNYLEWELNTIHENNESSPSHTTSEEDKLSFEVLNL